MFQSGCGVISGISFGLQEVTTLKEENAKLRKMRTHMDDELNELTENLFGVCDCVWVCSRLLRCVCVAGFFWCVADLEVCVCSRL